MGIRSNISSKLPPDIPMWPFVDQMMVSGGNFLTIALSANYLNQVEHGKFGYAITLYLGLVIWNMTAIFQTAAVQAPRAKNASHYHSDLSLTQCIYGFLSAVLATSVFVSLSAGYGWGEGLYSVLLLFAFFFVQQLADFDRRSAYIFGGERRAALSSLLIYPARIGAIILVHPDNFESLMYVIVLPSVIPSILTVSRSFRSSFCRSISGIRDSIGHTKWLLVSGPFVWFWGSAPIFIIGWAHGVEMVASFFTIRSLSSFSNIVFEVLETSVSARVGRASIDGRMVVEKALNKLLVVGVFFWLSMCGVIWAYGGIILNAIFGNDYSHYKDVLLILFVGISVMFVFRVVSIRERTVGDVRLIPASYAVGALVVCVSGYFLVPSFELVGASTSIVFGAVSILCTLLFFGRKLKAA